MKLESIAFNNLRRRKSRMAFLVLGLMIGVATVVTLVSLSSALTADIQHKMENYGANILITPRSDNLSLSYGGITLGGVSVDSTEIQQVDLEKIMMIPNNRNIAAVAPKVLGAVEIGQERVMLMGVDIDKEFHLKRWWSIDGLAVTNDRQLVAGYAVAQKLGLQVGNKITVAGEEFQISGVLAKTGSQDDQLLIGSLPMAQQLLNKNGTVSLVEVAALCSECPVTDMVKQIGSVLPGVEVSAIQQVVKTRMHSLEQFRTFSLVIAGVVLLIGALVVFVTMMGAVNERTREIGIFRALGFRRSHVMRLILMESSAVSLLAGLLGFLTGMGATEAILPFMTEQEVKTLWDPALGAGAILLALVVGCIASFYPALQASRLDPTEALRSL
ncbi:FtsX-like permease family protein [Malonomonas rubra]|uniref:ABC transporter permease n=1 Tax=Malonomonas rubra TaxID=57040 RepID=UPI0026EA1674|nr:FtsX-like permease family protein [Malonomonas rubra]